MDRTRTTSAARLRGAVDILIDSRLLDARSPQLSIGDPLRGHGGRIDLLRVRGGPCLARAGVRSRAVGFATGLPFPAIRALARRARGWRRIRIYCRDRAAETGFSY